MAKPAQPEPEKLSRGDAHGAGLSEVRSPAVNAQLTAGPRARVEVGDWLALAATLEAQSVDFVYADIPFGTGRVHRTPAGANRVASRVASREGGGAGGADAASFDDRFAGPAELAAWLRARLVVTLPAVRDSGLVAIHCDWRACAHVRLLLDELLGPAAFVNHLIWSYGLGGSSPRGFARKHDDILLFARRAGAHWFEAPRVPATSARLRGQSKKMTDVLAIPAINNMAAERTGYPTQKPLALLEVLVGACCPPGGVVLDPCCGSGTSLVAAARLGRDAVGFDVSKRAAQIARERLWAARTADRGLLNVGPMARPGTR